MEADLFPPDWHYNRAGSASRTWDTPDGTAYTLHLLLASDGVYVLHAVGQQGVQLFPRPIEFQADDYHAACQRVDMTLAAAETTPAQPVVEPASAK